MNRFAWWRRRRHDGSRSTALGERSRLGSIPRPTAAVLPDGDGQLSDGVVIETRLKARLFGAPVLRVDGTVVVSPGRLVELPARRVVDDGHEVVASTNGTSERTASVSAPGEGLARAAQLIADTDGNIARWQRS